MSSDTSNTCRCCTIDEAPWNLILPLIADAIVKLGLAIIVGYTVGLIVAKLHLFIRSLISEYRRRRTPNNGLKREKWMRELISFFSQRSEAEQGRFWDVYWEWLQMPEKVRDAYFIRQIPRIFGADKEKQPWN
ncbi:uncharacterized protein LOC135836976 [Planococcus citri]|uniref:uncharacterized protein LOC135836976 n=1 Tax=Planococcus citri TaxID=170843 RepID=UPI0031F8A00F